MRRLVPFWLLLTGVLPAGGEIIDRIAVTVDKMVITQSDLVSHLRIAAFLNAEPLKIDGAAKREAANRLVDQVLVRREMEISRYPAPTDAEVVQFLGQILRQRGITPEEYPKALAEYGISDSDVKESLLLQLMVLRFIEYRFRPGVAVTDEEVENYYQNTFVPKWGIEQPSKPVPDLDDARDDIEEALIQVDVNRELDRWLKQAATRAAIQYRKEAFE